MDKSVVQLIFLSFLFLLIHFCEAEAATRDCSIEPKTTEGRLKKRLFCNYDQTSRPSAGTGPIVLKIKLIVKGFNFVDYENKLTVSSWLAMSWTDDNLKWSTSQFNLNTITESSEVIWMPDLALYNSDVSSSHDEFCKKSQCVIASSGLVSCIPPCTHNARCESNYKRWPYDTQNCTLHIGTWVNSGEEIDFRVQRAIVTDEELSSQSGEYRLIRATYKRNPGNFSITSNTYPSITYSFLIERHSGKYSAALVIPAIVLTLINLLSLWVEPENVQRLILQILSILVISLFIQIIFYSVPANADVTPDIITYFKDMLLSTGLLIVLTIILRNISACECEVPTWIESANVYIGSNKVGQLLLRRNLINKQPFHSENGTDDSINLVEAQPNAEKLPKDSKPWKTFAKIIDRLAFIVLGLIYIFMILALVPEGFLDAKYQNKVEIVGY